MNAHWGDAGSSMGQPTNAGHPNLLPMLSGPQQKTTMSRGGPVTGGQVTHQLLAT